MSAKAQRYERLTTLLKCSKLSVTEHRVEIGGESLIGYAKDLNLILRVTYGNIRILER